MQNLILILAPYAFVLLSILIGKVLALSGLAKPKKKRFKKSITITTGNNEHQKVK